MQQLMTRKRNLRTQAEHFASLYPDGIPSWWLKHRYNDTLILHLYRIIDQEHGSDLISPLSPPAVCQHVVQDFRGKEMQCLSLHHSSAVSSFPNQPWNQTYRPFLSFGLYLERLHDFARQKEMISHRDGRVSLPASLPPQFARFYLIVAWRYGFLQEFSYVDVSSIEKATEYYAKIRNCTDCNDWKDKWQIDYQHTICNLLKRPKF